MAEALHSGNAFIYIAYIFITLSYLNVNILFIRLFLIGASLCFILFAITFGNVFVDSLVFNAIFVLINGTYSYFLILKYFPVKLTPLEERIYQKDFQKVMDRRTFQHFIRRAHLRTFSEGGQICHQGNNFSGPFYIAMVNPAFKIVYIQKGKEYMEVKENSWIGVVEYTMYEKNKIKANFSDSNKGGSVETGLNLKKQKVEKVKWAIDALVKENISVQFEKNDAEDPIFQIEEDPCYVYEFPLGELEKLFQDKNEGSTWRNALYSVWLGYTTKAIIKVDDKVKAKMMRKKHHDSLRNGTFEHIQLSYLNNNIKENPNNANRIINDFIESARITTESNYLVSQPNINTDRDLLSDRDPVNKENILIEMKKLQKLEK